MKTVCRLIASVLSTCVFACNALTSEEIPVYILSGTDLNKPVVKAENQANLGIKSENRLKEESNKARGCAFIVAGTIIGVGGGALGDYMYGNSKKKNILYLFIGGIIGAAPGIIYSIRESKKTPE